MVYSSHFFAVAVRHDDDDAAQHAVEHADAVVDAVAVDDRRSHADQDGHAGVDAVAVGGAANALQ